MVRSLIGLFAFRSNPVSKVYQHRSRNDGILEVTWSKGGLRKNYKRHIHLIHFRNLLMEQARIEHAPNGSLLTYITSADAALVNKCSQTCSCKKGSDWLKRWVVIGSKGGWKLSTIFLSCKVFDDWSIIKLGNILYLLDGYIFAVLFETTSHCF